LIAIYELKDEQKNLHSLLGYEYGNENNRIFMKSKDTQMTQKNYLGSPDKLQCLTGKFRSSLKERRDEKNEPTLISIDGEIKPLLCASITEVLDYALEYTKMWRPIPDEQKEDFKHDWFIDCRGLYISYTVLDFNDAERENTRDWAPVQFDHSVIIGSCFLFVGRVFIGYAYFYSVEFLDDAHFNESQFHREVNFDYAVFSRAAFFSECEFKFNKGASFQQTTFSRRVDFANACFNRVPLFHETKLPQASSFHGAKFNKEGSGLFQHDIHEDVIALRTLRQIAASYKGQQDEAKFFALEQRYYRKVCFALRLVWHKESAKVPQQDQQGLKDLLMRETRQDTWQHRNYWSIRCNLVEWFISCFYDWITEYGSNPSRAVGWLLAINAVAWSLYLNVCTFGECSLNPDFCLSKDASIFAQHQPALFFVLQNLFNPSAIVSYKALVIANNPFMLVLAIFQFCSTYIVLILTALAIRARFQKGGGGDK